MENNILARVDLIQSRLNLKYIPTVYFKVDIQGVGFVVSTKGVGEVYEDEEEAVRQLGYKIGTYYGRVLASIM